MFDGFTRHRAATSGAGIAYRKGGCGPPLLLLHGYPQTHVMWHRVAPALAREFTVVCPDLRGYGDSGKPPSAPDHAPYAKRAMATDMVELMTGLGFDRFAVAGHDRGGRVTHRLCLDHAPRITRAAVLDIVPTATLFERTDMAFALGYYHWFFLAQPEPLPERLIGASAEFFLKTKLGQWSGDKTTGHFASEALAEYVRCWTPETVHASCEDYRAAATIDLEHDRADAERKIACPLLVLWGGRGLMDRLHDVLAAWRDKAAGPVEGSTLPCGHYLPEEAPGATLDALRGFFLVH